MRSFERAGWARTGSRVVRGSLALAALSLSGGFAQAAGGSVSGRVEAMPAKFLEESVVYLKDVAGSYPAKKVALDQRGMKFDPHVLVVTAGDTVEFLNHDTVAHNVFSPDNEGYNLGTFKPGETRSYTFKTAGVYTQLCSIHPEMLGFVFVGQNPYAAVVDREGRFTIKDVPPGTYTIAVWNSHLKAPDKKVTVAEGKTAEESFSLHR
jgi:plastocyanin